MRTLKCDIENCKNIVDIPNNFTRPEDWANITITGSVPRANSNTLIDISNRKDVCPYHVDIMFDYNEDAPKSLQEQMEDAMSDYVNDLAIDAIESAVENQ